MPEKKKPTVEKGPEKRMSKPQAPKTVKTGEPVRGTARSTAAAAPGSNHPSTSQTQLGNFEAAMRLFHLRNLKDARELFQLAAAGPERDVANRATLHLSMCNQRLHQPAPVDLGSSEEYYNYGVAVLNTRNAAEARTHLEKALQMSPGADHILYALALAQAIGGDYASAYDNLKRAIELEPRNRSLARQEADFVHLASQPPFDGLLFPEKKGW
jgi:tetratricopeptide (TPR) repeat protein